MAKNIHRKLFPTLSTVNQTQDCPDFCDPACPYNCYSFPDYNLPPPSPPIHASSHHSSQPTHIFSIFIILVSLFSLIFVLLAFYIIKAKLYAHWCGGRPINGSPSHISESDHEFLDQNHVNHPIWLITTIGLQHSLINSITVCNYKRGEGLIEGTECSVCLNDFREGETLRLLPKCNHAFHIPCIDTWLRSHTNCPLCRAPIVSNNEPDVSDLASTEIQTENSPNGASGNRVGTEEHQVLNDETQIGIRCMSMDARVCDSRISSSTEPENQTMFNAKCLRT